MKYYLIGAVASGSIWAANIQFRCGPTRGINHTYLVGNATMDTRGDCILTEGRAIGYLFSYSNGVTDTRIFDESNMRGNCSYSKSVNHIILSSNPSPTSSLQIYLPSGVPSDSGVSADDARGTLTLIENGNVIHADCFQPEIRSKSYSSSETEFNLENQ